MKNAPPILAAVTLLLLIYVGSYFWSVRPVEVVWLPGKHVPAYLWGDHSKLVFEPLFWLDTFIRPAYWYEDRDINPSW
jgi:hypothetical protein